MRVVVAGTGRLGVSILEPILDSPKHEVAGLILNGRQIHGFARTRHVWSGRFLPRRESPLPWAIRDGIPIAWMDRQNEPECKALATLAPDVLITCGFSIILKPQTLALPRIGCVNVHSSLLPKHRGPCPFNHVILANETESGVTFHVTAEGIDSGDILDQTPFPVERDDTAFGVYNKACDIARERVLPVLDAIEKDGLKGTPQDESQATYDAKFSPKDFRLRWKKPAAELHRLIRSCMPYESAYFMHNGRAIKVYRAAYEDETVEAEPGTVVRNRPGIRIATGAGTLTVQAGWTTGKIPWIWPMPWNRPEIGERLE